MNQVILTEVRVVTDLILKYPANSEIPYVQFVVVSNKFVKGEKRAQFIPLVAFGSLAINFTTYMEKGSLINIIGEIVMNQYEDKDGKKRNNIQIRANRIEYLSKTKKVEDTTTDTQTSIDTTEKNSFEDVSDIRTDDNEFTGFGEFEGGDSPF